MKQALISLVRFSRAERLGYALLALIAMLFIGLVTMGMWATPAGADAAAQQRMAAAYAVWKAQQDSAGIAYGGQSAPPDIAAAILFPFDPNTLDSAGFIRLGLPARALKGLLNWRRKGKHFYKPEDLKPLYNLPEETYARLAPYIRIAGSEDRPATGSFSNSFPAIPAVIDLNTADSALLDRGISGIGATLAHKIVARRAALGGFLRHEQLLEVYKFPDTTFEKMKERLRINPAEVRRMNLNSVTLAQLSAHPYIGEKTGKNILLLREGIQRYESVEQLRQAPLMTEEIYRKIAPYFVVETPER